MRAMERLVGVTVAAVWMASCATVAVPPSLPSEPRFAAFVYPTPAPGATETEASGVERGWRFLQAGDLMRAEREFQDLLERNARLYPARAGAAYVLLAGGSANQALSGFDEALAVAPAYAPALAGRGQALIGLERHDDAADAFEAALMADPSLVGMRGQIEVLRLRGLQRVMEEARAAARGNRLVEARTGYQAALERSADAAVLHKELGDVERRLGEPKAALSSLRRAAELDPSDAAVHVEIGDLLEQQSDFEGAEQAYRAALARDATLDLAGRLRAIAAAAREARLPKEFHAIGGAPHVTRGELAALIGIRLDHVLREAQPKAMVTTDTRDHWASPWIGAVVQAGIIEPFTNHTFQPGTRVRRSELATAASRLLTVAAANRPQLRSEWAARRPKIADVNPGHLNYSAVSLVVAADIMPLLDGGQFQMARPVSGAEAVDVIARLNTLSRQFR